MKKKIFTLCLFAAFILNIYSQAPESFQYQAIVSDNNTTLVNTDVSVRFTIREKQQLVRKYIPKYIKQNKQFRNGRFTSRKRNRRNGRLYFD